MQCHTSNDCSTGEEKREVVKGANEMGIYFLRCIKTYIRNRLSLKDHSDQLCVCG